MSNIETPEYDIDYELYGEKGESSFTATYPVRIVERVETNWEDRSSDTKQYGDEYREISHEGEYTVHTRLGNSLVNIDAYFDPDWSLHLDAPDEWVLDGHGRKNARTPPGHRQAERLGAPTLDFDLYEHELIEAAKQRALEDATHHVRVLAGWFSRAAPARESDPFDRWAATPFRRALLQEHHDYPHVDWAVAYMGDPDRWRGDEPPVGSYGAEEETLATTLELSRELTLYEAGGMASVLQSRDEELGVTDDE